MTTGKTPKAARTAESTKDADAVGYRVLRMDEPVVNRFGVTWRGDMEVDAIAPYYVSFVARSLAGRLYLESFAITYGGLAAVDSVGAGVTPVLLRKVSLPDVLRTIRWEASVQSVGHQWQTRSPERLAKILQSTADMYRPLPRKRVRTVGDDQLRALAERRLELDEDGDPSPVETLAAELNYSVATIRDRLRKATEAGWLAPSSRGARKRSPGPRLMADDQQLQVDSEEGPTDD